MICVFVVVAGNVVVDGDALLAVAVLEPLDLAGRVLHVFERKVLIVLRLCGRQSLIRSQVVVCF